MTDNEETGVKAISNFKLAFQKSMKHHLDEVDKSNNKFLKGGGLKAAFMIACVQFSEPHMLLHNFCSQAVTRLEKVEDLLRSDSPSAVTELNELKKDFERHAEHLKKTLHNPFKKTRR